jgi:SOS-response transcriptional repressor LexA
MDERSKRGKPPRLTDTELRILAALEDLSEELGYAPTYRQMLERIGWSPNSKGSLHQYLSRLRALGVVEGTGRSLRVVKSPSQNDRS